MKFRNLAVLTLSFAPGAFPQDAAPADSSIQAYHSFLEGVLAIQDHQWQEAVKDLTQVTQLDPKQGAPWARLGEAYYGMARSARAAESDRALRNALDAYAKAVELTPEDAGYHNGYALALAASGRMDEMQPEIEKAAKLDAAKAPQYYYTFGGMLLSSGRPDAAANELAKAAAAAPTVPEVQFQYASALCSQARVTDDGKAVLPSAAVEAFRAYLQFAPDGLFTPVVRGALAFDGSAIEMTLGEPLAPKVGAPKALTIGGRVQQAKLITKPQPAYPTLARRLRVAGTVSLEALISEGGSIAGLSVVSGNPFLIGAALNTVKQWTYQPTLLKGQPVQVRTRIDVTFSPASSSRASQ
jgi:TonB family protein